MNTEEFIAKTAKLLEEIDSSFRIVNFRSKKVNEGEIVDALIVQHLGWVVKQGQWSNYCDEVTVLEVVAFMFKEFGIKVFQDNRDIIILDEENIPHLVYAVRKEPYQLFSEYVMFPPLIFIEPSPDEKSKCAIFADDHARNYIWKDGELFHLKSSTGKLEKVNAFLKTRAEVILAGKTRLEKLGVVNYLWGAP